MNFSRFSSKIDPSHNKNHATVTVPSTPDANKGPAQADPKGNEAKPTVQAPGTPDVAKSDGESMVSEGGHASPGKAPDAIREPYASITGMSEPSKGSADGADDKPALSAKSSS